MKISICDTDRLIAVNKLEEVTSPNIFSNKRMMYDPSGVMSSDIFGISKGDRRNTFAWINLRRHFIHPHLYSSVLKSMFSGIIYITSGQRRYSVKDGQLVEDKENGWTGLESLYQHWNEINWAEHKSANVDGKAVLSKLRRDQVFITKFIVNPPAYRDVTVAGTLDSSDHVHELTKYYQQLIRLTITLSEGGIFAKQQYSAQSKVQDLLVTIYNFCKSQISSKYGLIRRYLLGKTVDFGVRSVISAPNYNHEHFEDNIVDVEHVALPISQCCSTFYPFIESWLKNFFTREIINDPNLITYYDSKLKKEITATLKDPEVQFSEKNIRKMINDYTLNPDNRFKVINVDVNMPTADGDKVVNAVMLLKGKVINKNDTSALLNRALTVTDVLYLACVDVCEKRHVMVSRYPVGTDKGIFFANIRVQSTTEHCTVVFNDKEYPYYPQIDFSTPYEKVGVQFVDAMVMSNSHLEGMGADYDGDQISVRGIWSDEANLEADEIMNGKMSALNINGTNSKVVSKEVLNALFELTKVDLDPKTLSNEETQKFLDLTPSSITRSFLVNMFADTTDASQGNNTKRQKSTYQTWDKLKVPANYFYDGQEAITTTVGRFVFNKFVLEGSGIIPITKYIDATINKNSLGSLDNQIGRFLIDDIIDREKYNRYLDRRDTIGYWTNGMLAHTISARMLKPLPEVEKKKKELFKKYEKELASGNIDVMTKVSDEIIKYAKELLKDDPGFDLYVSGELSFENNYKNNSILKGAVMNKITNEFDFIGTSFMNGIDIKDLPAHANSIVASQYPASISTANAGYLGKKLLALLQMMELDEPDSECGTQHPMHVHITRHNKDNFLYRYIVVGKQLVLLNEDNLGSYVGKEVLLRTPMSCISHKICSRCAGELFYKMNIEHAGLFATQISHSDLNLALKSKHDTTVSLFTLDPDLIIEDV